MTFYADLDHVRCSLDRLEIDLPTSVAGMVRHALSVPEPARYKLTFAVERKRKPRTTGPKSQSAHLHGHLATIADSLGYYLSEIKEVMKEDLPDWPRKVIVVGGVRKTVYMSEADADTVLEAQAITWCHVRASELGIILKESDDEDS